MINDNVFVRIWLFLFSFSCALFVVQPWSLSFGGIPIQVMIVWLLLFVLLAVKFKYLFKVIGLFSLFQWSMIVIMVASVFYRQIADGVDLLRFYQILSGVAIALLGGVAVTSKKGMNYLILGILTAAAISGFVALMQYAGVADWSWSRTVYVGTGMKQVSGLETSPVSYSYGVLPILVFGISAVVLRINGPKFLVGIPVGVLFFGCLMAFFGVVLGVSRSGMLAFAISFTLITVGCKFINIKFVPLLFCLLSLVVFLIADFAFWNKLEGLKESTSSDMRMGTAWELFLPSIMDFPYGVPHEIQQEARTQYSHTYGKVKNLKDVLRKTGGYDPHNFILTNALFFGIPAAIAIVMLYVSIFIKGIKAAYYFMKKGLKRKSAMILVLMGCNLSILIHSWFHNANIGFGEMRNWLWVGLLLGFVSHEQRFLRDNSLTDRA